jgi:Tfp pilus assembly protein PilX
MKNLNYRIHRTGPGARFQRGIITTFTGVLILLLLTIMMFFAVRVGVFDQRSSANDMRQKLAFHMAESGIHEAKEFFRANSVIVASSVEDILPNGTDGWLSAATGAARWQKCSDAGLNLATGSGTHPCFGEAVPARRDDLYFYSFGGSTEVPVDTDARIPGTTETVSVQALLCLLDVDYDEATPVQGCSTNTTDDTAEGFVDGSHYMITLLARGEGDCIGTDCNSEALVREQVSNFGAAAGGQAPSVPLTTKSTFPPNGTGEIVPNPNSGGVGVPVSVWMNANQSCSADGGVIDPSSGSWATCEAQEWYGVDTLPDDYICPTSACGCALEESISYTHGTSDIVGIDLVADPDFPCDLFKFYFGVPKESYELVKSFAQVLSDCTTLGPNSHGIIWITGPECRIAASTTIGSPAAPVLLIVAATDMVVNGKTVVFGVLYLSDSEEPAAALAGTGNLIVYGQVIIDGLLDKFQGTFQVVYNQNTVQRASGQGGLGNIIGGWADFHPSWQ